MTLYRMLFGPSFRSCPRRIHHFSRHRFEDARRPSFANRIKSHAYPGTMQWPDAKPSRQALEYDAGIDVFPVVGVSFGQRQTAVKQLLPGEAIMMVSEPGNPVDAAAIQVCRLNGTPLGYIPSHATSEFRNPITFGCIRSVGAAAGTEPPLYGCNVSTHPQLASLAPDVIPPSVQEECAQVLEGLRTSRELEPLRQALLGLGEYPGRCAVTNLALGQPQSMGLPGELVPVWLTDDVNRVVRLWNVLPMRQDLAEVMARLPSPKGQPSPIEPALRARLLAVNSTFLAASGVEQYLDVFCQQLMQARSANSYHLDRAQVQERIEMFLASSGALPSAQQPPSESQL